MKGPRGRREQEEADRRRKRRDKEEEWGGGIYSNLIVISIKLFLLLLVCNVLRVYEGVEVREYLQKLILSAIRVLGLELNLACDFCF